MAGQRRSWWGWGHVEDAVTGAEATALADRVRTLLPDVDLTEHVAPPVAELGLRPPRVDPPTSLARLCSTDLADRAAHTHGKAFRDVVRNLHGKVHDPPDLVIRPVTEQDVVDVLDWCAGRDIAVIPYGGGSSVVGGVEPRLGDAYPAAVSLDLGRLDRVLEVDRTSRAARIQAGVFGPALEDQLRRHDLTLRHFPQSFEFSTLGGWLATRAGGHYATVLTHIDDLVESLRVVTPAGISQSRRLPGSGAGPSPDRLFLGSEGVLGVITEAWMRLQDRPRWRAAASVHFTDYDEAVAATRAIAQSGLHPSNCRLLDPAEALLNAGAATTGGVLVLGFESADHPVTPSLDRAVELCRDHGASLPKSSRSDDSSGPRQRTAADAWRSSFLRMPYQRDALAARSMIVETFETACTWDRFPALRAAVLDAAGEALRAVAATGVVTCRFTHVYPDGPAPYFGVYATGRWGATLAQWDQIKHAVSDALLAAGGTITHHHAVGRDHRPWYDRQRPDPMALALRATKSALDPSWILNPGVLVDPAGRR
ncbi:FAD-binding oxidoreductase [Micromonospora sp. U21]|uniref:FAD-binding oxidoreductase n=1 Tax=Micromonospora sp. U21 TaxID=2824899 RepID=UPI001B35A739|nr:FAD-binding oxidoreductase [Micromonospora sp. U21]MBQ0904167.1 FAD-binding oxidoreductase [Micromonospora sp. U21]